VYDVHIKKRKEVYIMFGNSNNITPLSSDNSSEAIVDQATRVDDLIDVITKILDKITDKSSTGLNVAVSAAIELINELRKIDSPDDNISKFIELQKSLIDIKKAKNSRDLTSYTLRTAICVGVLGVFKGVSDIAAGAFKYEQGAGKESEGAASTGAGVFTMLASFAALYASLLYTAKNLENNHGDIKKGALDFSVALKGVRKSLSDRIVSFSEEGKASVNNLYKLSKELSQEIESLATSSSAQWDMTNPAKRHLLAASRSIEKILAEHTLDGKLCNDEVSSIVSAIQDMVEKTPNDESNANIISKIDQLSSYTDRLQNEQNISTINTRVTRN
jgi:hypothetical protein